MAIETRRTGAREYGRWMKVLIGGEPGAGKTLISSTFPNAFYASAEGGLMSVADRNIPYVEVSSSEALHELKTYLDLPPAVRGKALGADVDTIVIDTIDEVQRLLVRERLEAEKRDKLSLPDFGWLGEQMQSMIRGFRNLDMNVVFTCHLKETRDDELGRIVYKPGLQGAIADQIPGMVDLALLLTARSHTRVIENEARQVVARLLQTVPDAQHPWIKDRSGKLPSEMEVNFVDDWQRMNDLIFGSRPPDEIEEEPVPEPLVEPEKDTEEDWLRKGLAEEEEGLVEPDGAMPQAPTCSKCSTPVDNEDQATLSNIKFRKVLCQPCYKEAIQSKKSS